MAAMVCLLVQISHMVEVIGLCCRYSDDPETTWKCSGGTVPTVYLCIVPMSDVSPGCGGGDRKHRGRFGFSHRRELQQEAL